MWGQRCTVLLMHFSFYYLTVAFTTYDFSATSLEKNNTQTSTAIYLLIFSAYWKEMEVTHTHTHTHGAHEHERSRNLHPTELKLIHLFVGILLWGILSAHLLCQWCDLINSITKQGSLIMSRQPCQCPILQEQQSLSRFACLEETAELTTKRQNRTMRKKTICLYRIV